MLLLMTCRCRSRWAQQVKLETAKLGHELRIAAGAGKGFKVVRDGQVLLDRGYTGPAEQVAKDIVKALTGE